MNDDQDDKKLRMMPLGDIGVIGIALVFFVAFLWMMFAPSPFAGLFPPEKKDAAASTPQTAPGVSANVAAEPEVSGTAGEIVVPLAGKAAFVGDVPFPEIRDWNSLHITLVRSACFGTCPIYSVDISGDGTVSYDGLDCVSQKGQHTGHVSRDVVENLVTRFRYARYFSLRDRFAAQITDAPSYRTSIRFDDRAKSVLDYMGLSAGMPASVRDLEIAIDKAAGTDKWVGTSKGHCSWTANTGP